MKIGSTALTSIKIGSTDITKVIKDGVTYWESAQPQNVIVELIVGGYRITWDDPTIPYFRIEIYRTILGGSETFIATLASGVQTWDDLVYTGIQITYRLRTVILSAAYETETNNLISSSRYTTPPTAEFVDLINTTIKGLKDDGVFALADCMYVRGVHDVLFSKQNWIENAHNSTFIQSPVFTAKQGIKGNAGNAGINDNYTPSTDAVHFGLNDCTIVEWSKLQPTSTGMITIASYAGTTNGFRLYAYTAANERGYINSGISNTNVNVVDDEMRGYVRSGTSVQGFKNGVKEGAAVIAVAYDELPTSTVGELGYIQSGVMVLGSDAQIKFSFIGAALSEAQYLALYTRMKYYFDNMPSTF